MDRKLNTAGALAGVFLLIVGVWQLDQAFARLVWAERHWLEIASFGPHAAWFMWSTDFYNLCIFAVFLGALTLGISLWLWKD